MLSLKWKQGPGQALAVDREEAGEPAEGREPDTEI